MRSPGPPSSRNISTRRAARTSASDGSCRAISKGRIEVRRLLDWFLGKLDEEVTGYLVTEKVYKRFMTAENGGGSPDMSGIRAARSNVRYHLTYIGYLIAKRNWLAGDKLTYADLAAAAHLSVADYLGDVPWNEDETARLWYARVKSRPSFRALLADRVPGMTASVALRESRLLAGDELKRAVRERGRGLGFELVRVTTPAAIPLAPERLDAWLAAGHHGSMDWMAQGFERRADPRVLWSQVRSIVLVGLNYGPDFDPLRSSGPQGPRRRFPSMPATATITTSSRAS